MRTLLSLLLLCLAGAVSAADLKPYNGAALPDFTLSDTQGKAHTLSKYRGQVVMVNFWATYCGPCIKEIPSMQRLSQKLSGKPFTILAVNMAEEQVDVEAFLMRHKIAVTFPMLLNPEGNVVEQWMISAVPTTFLIDPQGQIRYALYGGLEWDSDEVVATISGMMK